MEQIEANIKIGSIRFDSADCRLLSENGESISLRPQSLQVLQQLVKQRGQVVGRDHLVETVWADLNVTDDSLFQCIADIRRTVGDKDHRIVQTVPKKGYKLALATPNSPSARMLSILPRPFIAVVVLLLAFLVGAWGVFSGIIKNSHQPTIAVLPFDNLTGSDRWKRLGRGLSIDIANELAKNQEFGVIGAETTYDVSKLEAFEAGKKLNATFVLKGEVEADHDHLRISARLLDVEDGNVVWSEKWHRKSEDYLIIQDDIVTRANASLVAHFWFGGLNRAIAENARGKPGPSLTAYEQYLLGVSSIMWSKADYGKALQHFYNAVEIDPSYARAWGMIGAMKIWIADVSKDEVQARLNNESRIAVRKAYLLEPHDAFIVFMMSSVHLTEGRVEAARRSVFTAVEYSPNNPDILAMAAWQSMAVGITGKQPVAWGKKAIDLNPKGPPWHKLGLATAAFGAGDYMATIVALENAPPHHKKFNYLAATHMILGNEKKARAAAETLRKNFPDYTLAGDINFPINPNIVRLMKYAAMAGVPMGDKNKIPVVVKSETDG